MASAAEEWFWEGYQEGRQKGRQEGRQEGGAGFFLRQLREQFGDLSDEVVQRVREADSDALAGWGMSLRSAESLDEVFSNDAGNGEGSNGRLRKG